MSCFDVPSCVPVPRPLNATSGAIVMPYRALKEVAESIAISFCSRNNDLDGYWALGKLYLEALAHQQRAGTSLADATLNHPRDQGAPGRRAFSCCNVRSCLTSAVSSLPWRLRQTSSVCSLMPYFLATAATGDLSASRRILTV